jgi:hypothetical protein
VLLPTEYSAVISDENLVVITFPYIPAANQFVLIISTINNVASFQDHQHRIGAITGDVVGAATLREELDAILLRLSTLESMVEGTGGLTQTDAERTLDFELPEREALFPGRYTTIPDLSGKVKLRASRLLPAIHDAEVVAITELPLPEAADYADSVFYNDTGAAFTLHGLKIPVGGFFGSDGRAWYPLERNAATNSYFPAEFARELWMLALNDAMLRPGMTFAMEGEINARIAAATTKVSCVLVIEVGTSPSQVDPTPTSENLENVIWNTANPLLSQRIVLTDTPHKLPYGCSITIDGLDVIATKTIYAGSSAAVNKPANANFVIRARLKDFDTENSVTGAKGLIYFKSTGQAGIS